MRAGQESRPPPNASPPPRVTLGNTDFLRGTPVNRSCIAAATALLVALAPRPVAAQTPTVDTSGAGVLIDQALTHSQAMANLQHLTDVVGPRLTGSPAARAANDWTLANFQEEGLDARLKPWHFSGMCTRAPMWMRLFSPAQH